MSYDFTNDWFGATGRYIWEKILPQLGPARILEIGSYEGRSTCFLIEALKRPLDIHCVDTWEGGVEHKGIDMPAVKARFQKNVDFAVANSAHDIQLHVHAGRSDAILSQMQPEYAGYFDFIYIDAYAGSGQDNGKILNDWWPKLKSGGIFAGHDYDVKWPATIQAVDQFCAFNNYKPTIIPGVEIEHKHNNYSSWYITRK